jgi:hypothetical protein
MIYQILYTKLLIMQISYIDDYIKRGKRANESRKALLLLVDKEIKINQKNINMTNLNSFLHKNTFNEEYIVVLEDTVYDSSSNKSELYMYHSYKSNDYSQKSTISPVSNPKSDNSLIISSQRKANEEKKKQNYVKSTNLVPDKSTILEAPLLKKKDLFQSKITKEKTLILEAFQKLKKLAYKLKIKDLPIRSIPYVYKEFLTNREELREIPSPLLPQKPTRKMERVTFSLKDENKDEIRKMLNNSSINILKEKNFGKKKSYSILDAINHVENNKDNSIVSNNQSSNSTSFFDEKTYLSESNMRFPNMNNIYLSPLKINAYEVLKDSVNNLASKLEFQYCENINLSPIEQSCINLQRCEFKSPKRKKPVKKDSFSITLKKC